MLRCTFCTQNGLAAALAFALITVKKSRDF
jgi:hypothetical protein